jgi:tetratricopeptide (TPR) repeat protein
MKSKSIMIALVLALYLGALPLWSQLGNMNIVQGRVTGADGKPLVGAEVKFTSKDVKLPNGDVVQGDGLSHTSKTDKRGDYTLPNVRSGYYDVAVAVNGNAIDKETNVMVTSQSSSAPCYVQNGVCRFDIDLSKRQGTGAMTAEEKKRREEAEKENAKIGDLNSQFRVAQDAEKAGDFDKAISILQTTTQTSPNSEVPWGNLAQAYLMAKRYPEAAEALKKAIAIKPDKAPFHMGLGDAYAGAGKPDDATAEYTTAAQMDPTQAAMAYFKIGAVWTNASTRVTDDATRKKDLATANDAFDKAVAAKPDFADAYYQKGINLLGQASFTKDGKITAVPGTAEAFQKYLELAPTGSHAEEAKQLLASLGAQVQTQFKKGKGK